MRLNWSTGIVIGMIGFIGFIMYFVITMSTNKNYSHDLVTEKYYQKELLYQSSLKAIENAKKTEGIKIKKDKEGLIIVFPKKFDSKKIEGSVQLYRPSNKKLDFQLPISMIPKTSFMLVSDKKLLKGRWNVTVNCKYKGQAYLFKKELFY
ncbi:FixH family protein [Tenacibaculum sp. 190524A02b]|uniref:FixH family protein n=1 Tax=Tenacibaculum vairaonense TaxID=3137860 RepID=A0ABP1F6R8_9FLAO